LNVSNFTEKSNFIWGTADLIRDTFKRGKYQDVILPFTVLRRIDSVLVPTKPKVLETYHQLKDRLDNLDPQLRRVAGYAFYNTSPYTFESLLDDAPNLAANLNAFINGFSQNMRDVIEKFDFRNTIEKLDERNLLYLVMERFKNVDLHPDSVSNLEMGYIFEDLIRRFNEALNENPGEHYTPREVIRLMVNLLLSQDADALEQNHIVRTVYDPCCGSGGMLTIAQRRIKEINPNAEVYLFGQEVNPETYAVSKSDMYLKSRDGRDAENIKLGSTLSDDQHPEMNFDYMITNPTYGKDWKMDQKAVEAEAKKGHRGRFGAGTPRVSDGQLLFLQHMLSKMRPLENGKGGSRIGIVLNGSPLFTGDAGSGESEIRRWILENDWLDAIVALPEQLFYNTGIATYIWILSNHKEKRRLGKVQLIDATDIWVPMRKSLGDKRREISDGQIEQITQMFLDFTENEKVKTFDSKEFGFRKIRVERPLRLNFEASPERIERLKEEYYFQKLAKSRKKDKEKRSLEEAAGREEQQELLKMLNNLPKERFMDRKAFIKILNQTARNAGISLSSSIKKAILSALSEQDEKAAVCTDSKGNPESDTDLRDYENVPLDKDIWEYFEREVKPYVPNAWIDETYTDNLDGEIGRVGYEINFNRYFYEYEPPRPLEEIEADIAVLQEEIIKMLKDVTK
jgi:type I restriction enzyme M protein